MWNVSIVNCKRYVFNVHCGEFEQQSIHCNVQGGNVILPYLLYFYTTPQNSIMQQTGKISLQHATGNKHAADLEAAGVSLVVVVGKHGRYQQYSLVLVNVITLY